MRVLVVSAWPPWPLADGARLVLHHHLRHLAPRHEVTLLATGHESGAPVAAPDVLDALHAVQTFPMPSRSTYPRRRMASWRQREPADAVRVASPALMTAFADARRRGTDVVHLHGWGTAHLARLTGEDTPVVHVAIDRWAEGLRAHRALPAWRRFVERGELDRVERHEATHYQHCDRVVLVSDVDADVLARLVPGVRVAAVPNGVDLGPEPPQSRPAGVLGFHGALSTPANADAARRLVHDVLPRVPGARALIIGRDPPDDLRRRAAHADGRVTVTGAVDDIAIALRDVTVYVAPIEQGGGLRNKVLEAMAAALPVVATRRAVQGIGDGDGVVVADDVDGMARASARLLADADEARAIGTAGRARVARDFTWARSAEAIEALWRDLAG